VSNASRGFDAIEFWQRKSPEFPCRNAKTRWGEPAGQFASSHLAAAQLVEAAGIHENFKTLGFCVFFEL
jgi:hypothetical protein